MYSAFSHGIVLFVTAYSSAGESMSGPVDLNALKLFKAHASMDPAAFSLAIPVDVTSAGVTVEGSVGDLSGSDSSLDAVQLPSDPLRYHKEQGDKDGGLEVSDVSSILLPK